MHLSIIISFSTIISFLYASVTESAEKINTTALDNTNRSICTTKCGICSQEFTPTESNDKLVCNSVKYNHFFHSNCILTEFTKNSEFIKCQTCTINLLPVINDCIVKLILEIINGTNSQETKNTLFKYFDKMDSTKCESIFNDIEVSSLESFLNESYFCASSNLIGLQQFLIKIIPIIDFKDKLENNNSKLFPENDIPCQNFYKIFTNDLIQSLAENNILNLIRFILRNSIISGVKKFEMIEFVYRTISKNAQFQFSNTNTVILYICLSLYDFDYAFKMIDDSHGFLRNCNLSVQEIIYIIKSTLITQKDSSYETYNINLKYFIKWILIQNKFTGSDLVDIASAFKLFETNSLTAFNLKSDVDYLFCENTIVATKSDIKNLLALYSNNLCITIEYFLIYLKDYFQQHPETEMKLLTPLIMKYHMGFDVLGVIKLSSYTSFLEQIEGIFETQPDNTDKVVVYIIMACLDLISSETLIELIALCKKYNKKSIMNFVLFKVDKTVYENIRLKNLMNSLVEIVSESEPEYIRYFLSYIDDSNFLGKYTFGVNESYLTSAKQQSYVVGREEPYTPWYEYYDNRVPFCFRKFNSYLSEFTNKSYNKTFKFIYEMCGSPLFNMHMTADKVIGMNTFLTDLPPDEYLKCILLILSNDIPKNSEEIILSNLTSEQYSIISKYLPAISGTSETKVFGCRNIFDSKSIFNKDSPAIIKAFIKINKKIIINWLISGGYEKDMADSDASD